MGADASPRIIVVSGLPAAGKTSIAHRLGPRLGIEVVDKDDDLEALFDEHLPPRTAAGPAERHRLSRLADTSFRDRALATDGALLVSFWRRDARSASAGTPTDWLSQLGNVRELHCRCDADIAAQRFVTRRRHAGHGDATELTVETLDRFRALGRMGPLGIGPVTEIATDVEVSEADIDELAHQLAAPVTGP